jgi:hypothetical protein
LNDIIALLQVVMVDLASHEGNRSYRGPKASLMDEIEQTYNDPAFVGIKSEIVDSALNGLHEIGIAAIHPVVGGQTQVLIDSGKFHKTFGSSSPRTAMHRLAMPMLAAYFDVGPLWLRETLQARATAQSATSTAIPDNAITVVALPDLTTDSSTWTGVEKHLEWTHDKSLKLVVLLDEASVGLSKLSLSNSERSQIFAYLSSIRALAEAPDPPLDLVWTLVDRTNKLAGIAGLFISILSLFSAASR